MKLSKRLTEQALGITQIMRQEWSMVIVNDDGEEISNRTGCTVRNGMITNTEPLVISGAGYANVRLVNPEGTEHLDL